MSNHDSLKIMEPHRARVQTQFTTEQHTVKNKRKADGTAPTYLFHQTHNLL